MQQDILRLWSTFMIGHAGRSQWKCFFIGVRLHRTDPQSRPLQVKKKFLTKNLNRNCYFNKCDMDTKQKI